MNSFKFVLSTSRKFEKVAEAEIWFQLMMLGDENPIIFHTSISGILLVDTTLDPYICVKKLRKILKKDPNFFQYLLKLIPIDKVVSTDLDIMKETIDTLIEKKKQITKQEKFVVQIRKRATNLSKKQIIDFVTVGIDKSVDIKNPNWIIQIEIIGDTTGIAIFEPDAIFEIYKEKELILNN